MSVVVALNDVLSGARSFEEVEEEAKSKLSPELRSEWAEALKLLKELAELLHAATGVVPYFLPSEIAALEREHGRLLTRDFLGVLEHRIGEGRFYFPGASSPALFSPRVSNIPRRTRKCN